MHQLVVVLRLDARLCTFIVNDWETKQNPAVEYTERYARKREKAVYQVPQPKVGIQVDAQQASLPGAINLKEQFVHKQPSWSWCTHTFRARPIGEWLKFLFMYAL